MFSPASPKKGAILWKGGGKDPQGTEIRTSVPSLSTVVALSLRLAGPPGRRVGGTVGPEGSFGSGRPRASVQGRSAVSRLPTGMSRRLRGGAPGPNRDSPAAPFLEGCQLGQRLEDFPAASSEVCQVKSPPPGPASALWSASLAPRESRFGTAFDGLSKPAMDSCRARGRAVIGQPR